MFGLSELLQLFPDLLHGFLGDYEVIQVLHHFEDELLVFKGVTQLDAETFAELVRLQDS